MSQLSTFFPTVTATSLGLGNSANVTFGSVTAGSIQNTPIGSTTRNTGAFTTLNATNGTITASAPVLDLSQTWNNAAVAFTGLRFDVTNTNSSTSSRLVHLTVGGTFNAIGIYRDASGFAASPRFEIGSAGVTWNIRTRTSAGVGCNFDATVGIGGSLQFGVGTTTAQGDVIVTREAADTLALQRGTSAQTFRLYNTFTDASNYERGFMRWSSNVLQIGTEAGGTGSIRQIQFPLGTVAASTPMEITQTWNNSAIPFTAFRINVTNTASQFSGATSLLQEWQLGGVTVANVQPSGTISCRGLGTSSGGTVTINGCYTMAGPAGGVMEVRQGTTPMDVRFFNTVSGSNNVNFERANLRWASNEFIIDTAAGGNGTLRGIKIGSATSSLLGFYGAVPVDQPATVADPAGGGTVDTEARTAINAIIDRLQELGLIA